MPSPANPPKGCRFCTRCPKVMDICKTDRPDFKEVEPGHSAHVIYMIKSKRGIIKWK